MSDPTRIVDDVVDEAAFINLASTLGRLMPAHDGGFIKELKVTVSEIARTNTLSSRFGTGSFPFHTDAAYLNRPPRWVLLRAKAGDLHRSTHLMSFDTLLQNLSRTDISRSAWICNTGARPRYTTLSFGTDKQKGYRFDPVCMSPANNIAKEIDTKLRCQCFDLEGEKIEWKLNRTLIIDNWHQLHARGIANMPENGRVLQRIYVY